MSGKTSEEKVFPPSKKKLEDARRKGQVASCRELVTAAGSAVVLGYVMLRGPALLGGTAELVDAAAGLCGSAWDEAHPALLRHAAVMAGGFVLPLLGLLFGFVFVAGIVGHGGLVFSADPLKPKMERLNPAEGLTRMFELRNGVEALKTLFKFLVLAVTSAVLLRSAFGPLVELPACGLTCVPGLARGLIQPLLMAAVLMFLVLGGLDLGVQRFLFRREQRMTHTERKRERKETQGNPLIKNAHRRERNAAMRNHVRTGLANASFVIHGDGAAVALCYRPPDVLVPALVARAGPQAAALLAAEAGAAGLPCVQDPDTAGMVYARVQLGGLIPQTLFAPVIACMRTAGVV